MFKEFREFAVKGSVIDMAVGVIIGAAFGTIVNSLVNDIIMPPIGVLLGNVDFSNLYTVLKGGSGPEPYASVAEAQKAGAVTLNWGLFLNHVITFLIVSFAVFLLVRSINRLRRQQESEPVPPATKECPFCRSTIPAGATRCAHCTSELSAAG